MSLWLPESVAQQRLEAHRRAVAAELAEKLPPPPAGNRNSWERGVARDHRGVPYLDSDLEPIPLHRFASYRAHYEERIRRLHQHPDPFGTRHKE